MQNTSGDAVAAIHQADHSTPLHDGFCRCRRCKPPLVGQASQSLQRIHVALATGGIAAIVVAAAKIGGL